MKWVYSTALFCPFERGCDVLQCETLSDWQQILKEVVTDLDELCRLLGLPMLPDQLCAIRDFPLRVPRRFVGRMERGNWHDPLLLQVLPKREEMHHYPGFSCDPLRESQVNPVPGLLHKYHGRVLVTLTGGCAIHCRYCFRRHFSYEDNISGCKGWDRICQYIACDRSISEVILSGGDPLLVKDTFLRTFLSMLNKIPHLRRVRIHTRLPVVIPERVNEALLNSLEQSRLHATVVLHCNHPNEIDRDVVAACVRFRQRGIILLNQSVLLSGVNNDHDVLICLSERLFDAGVLPYYLHVLDCVRGAFTFAVDESAAKLLMKQMLRYLPGYLVPRLVKEEVGAVAKTLVPVM